MINRIDHKHMAKMIAKKAISEVILSTRIPESDRGLIFKELEILSGEISETSINDRGSWLAIRKNDIGSNYDM